MQRADADLLLNWHRRLIALRRSNQALRNGRMLRTLLSSQRANADAAAHQGINLPPYAAWVAELSLEISSS